VAFSDTGFVSRYFIVNTDDGEGTFDPVSETREVIETEFEPFKST